ncbi:tetranectin-like [Mustelus asterias]
MQPRGAFLVLFVLCLLQETREQSPNAKPRKNAAPKKALVTLSMIQDIKAQISQIQADLTVLKEHQALQTVCLRGVKVHRKCFLKMPEQKSFHEAAEDCILHGGTLSTPLSHDENDALYDYARATLGDDHNIWVGMTDLTVEGDWVDMTGKGANYTNWETYTSKQPDGGTRANCVALSGSTIGKWLDESCRLQKSYFCQFTIP